MKLKRLFLFCLSMAFCSVSFAESLELESKLDSEGNVIRVVSVDGKIEGEVFAMLDGGKTPLMSNVSLTDSEGTTISTFSTDLTGKFSFNDVEPGRYKAVGISGDYVGEQEFVIAVGSSDETEQDSESVYTSIPLAVSQAPVGEVYSSYGAMPMSSFSTVASPVLGSGSCSTCGGGGGYAGSCGGSALGGGFNFRRLALIGAAVAIPVALSGGNDDMATPAED